MVYFRSVIMEEREELLNTLQNHFLSDFILSIEPLEHEEKIHFMELLSEYLKGIYNPTILQNHDNKPFDSDYFLESNILKPYREKMTAFVRSGLRYYMTNDEFSKTMLFVKLGIKEPVLSNEEQFNFANCLYLILRYTKESLYLKPVEHTGLKEKDILKLIEGKEPDEHSFKSKSAEYTRSRQVLLYYFVLKLMGMTKLNNSSRKYAQFAHVLFAYPIDNIDNSAVYKLLKKAPYLKKDHKELLKDYEFVKSQFELIGSAEGVALVQKEIVLIKH